MKGGYVLPTVGTPPASVPQPTEPGFYWVRTAHSRWETISIDEPETWPDSRYNWTDPSYRWEVVEIREGGSVEACGSDCGFDWEKEHVVMVSARLQEPESEGATQQKAGTEA
jgi:hypothetical protein